MSKEEKKDSTMNENERARTQAFKNVMERKDNKIDMKEKDGLMIFTLKEANYLKEYYSNLLLGNIIRGNPGIKLTDIIIVDSNKEGMYALQVQGYQMNQSNIHIKTRIENLITELNLKHPKGVLKRKDV
ncbi:hypothetical protein R3X25_11750 [Lutibacter sp. TH_r2]|uniref:hypothetical protein n=1 Tax=Lutibacter sp. TH_r2 TaxID=3082083 RepID=UPI002953653D|nr:hypothetical protein [Lutibacter sp. TH_r2]MDV7187957.1 hypothetical protein [Lutibacter sp. TH_r2]